MTQKSLKTCVVIVTDLISAIGATLEDKKVTFGEILGLSPQLMTVPAFVRNLPAAIEEIKAGISDAYYNEIKQAVKLSVKLHDEFTEGIIELSVNWIITTSELAAKIQAAVKLSKQF